MVISKVGHQHTLMIWLHLCVTELKRPVYVSSVDNGLHPIHDKRREKKRDPSEKDPSCDLDSGSGCPH